LDLPRLIQGDGFIVVAGVVGVVCVGGGCCHVFTVPDRSQRSIDIPIFFSFSFLLTTLCGGDTLGA
jgi:hypothetical protein